MVEIRNRYLVNAVSNVVHLACTLSPRNKETKALIDWIDEPGRMHHLQRLAAETGVDSLVESVVEAIEVEMDKGRIPGLKEKWERDPINWHHVEAHLRKTHLRHRLMMG